MLKIGKLSLEPVERTVEEVEAELHRLTGLAVHEMHDLLACSILAGTVAAALLPLLAEPLERHALAEAIAKHGVHEVRDEVRALYAKILGDAAAEKAEGANGETKA